jgi:cytochrome oxidase Cu insertion factor (SCO1/SenC/PrrC family)
VKSRCAEIEPGYSGSMRVAVALLVVLVAAGCGSSQEEASPPEQTTTVAEPAMPGENREAAPPLTGESLNGETIALGDFQGRPVLINVWSSW